MIETGTVRICCEPCILESAAAIWQDQLKKQFCKIHGKRALAGQLMIRNYVTQYHAKQEEAVVHCFAICEECFKCNPMDCLKRHLLFREMPLLTRGEDYAKGVISADDDALAIALDKIANKTNHLTKNTHIN